MSPKLRRLLIGTLIAVAVAAGPLAFFDYFLPHHAILRIVGAETRRPFGSSKTSPATHDVFYVFAEDVDTHKPRVFRNEDTGWGFPWYFKFDSADLQAIAQSIAGERGTALLTYYGWRIRLFSVVPNITNIKRAGPDDAAPFPWFNFAFAIAVLGTLAWLALWLRRFWFRRS